MDDKNDRFELAAGDVVLLDVSGSHPCGISIVLRAEAEYIGRKNIDGVIYDVFEIEPPIVCPACREEIGIWLSSPIDIDDQTWSERLSNVEF